MDKNRTWYNARMVVSILLSIVTAISVANYYFGLGYFGNAARYILSGCVLIGIFYGLLLTPKKDEFRKHGWWWREGS